MTILSIDPEAARFVVDGEPTFLLGVSYYAGLGVDPQTLQHDLHDLKDLGFNWLRVWTTWSAFGHNVSAIDPAGQPRPAQMDRLAGLCQAADAAGMVVDVTFSRGNGVAGPGLLPTHAAHVAAVAAVSQQLKGFRNVYIDVANEHNLRDQRHVPFDGLRELRRRIKEIDPERLTTASFVRDIEPGELAEHLEVTEVDFLAPHRPRRAGTAGQTEGQTQEYVRQMQRLGRVVPVHYQEPFRCGFSEKWEPQTQDFLDDLAGAVRGGAAGWCFHNGDARAAPDGRPRRSFDMRPEEGRLLDQLLPKETGVVRQAADTLRSARLERQQG